MKRLFSSLAVAAVATFALGSAVCPLMPALAAEPADTVFGTRPNLPGVIKISELLEHPDKYVGKEIKVEGIATDVCPKRGCWMTVQSDKKAQSLFVKVADGEMVFPMSARGKHVVLQGKLHKFTMSLEQTIAFEKERASETGKTFDPKSVTKPRVQYLFKPSGAVIHNE